MKKIILCRTAWMKYYKGRTNLDIPRSGAKWILKHKTGGEIYNFKNFNGKAFGYFPDIYKAAIQNIGANRGDDLIHDVTVVFCARHPVENGIRVVGWYKRAIVYREKQSRAFRESFHTVTQFKNIVLLPEEDRVFFLPNTFGRNALYYIAQHPEKRKLLTILENYIAHNGKIEFANVIVRRRTGRAYQSDIGKRLKVEQKAMKTAMKYYSKRYGRIKVNSVEKENKGWDIEVKTKSKKLNVEVKGLSGSELNVELTPNEFSVFNQARANYQLFVVNNALARKPLCRVFKYQSKGDLWIGNDSSVLKVKIVKSARLTTN